MSIFLVFLIVLILILFNALYVAAEFSAVSARRSRLSQLADDGNRTAAALHTVIDDPVRLDAYVATCQLGITVSSLMVGFFGQPRLTTWIAPFLGGLGGLSSIAAESVSYTTVLLGLTSLQVVLGELVPKNIGVQYPERVSHYYGCTNALVDGAFSAIDLVFQRQRAAHHAPLWAQCDRRACPHSLSGRDSDAGRGEQQGRCAPKRRTASAQEHTRIARRKGSGGDDSPDAYAGLTGQPDLGKIFPNSGRVPLFSNACLPGKH